MPALSSTMTEGKIVSWNKSEGDTVNKGESVVVVESDKADMDVETFYAGIIASILVADGEVAPVGAPIAIIAETEDEIAEAQARGAKAGGAADPVSAPPPPPPAAAAPPPPPPPPAPAAPAPEVVVSSHPSATGGRIVATPYAKKLAKQFKVGVARNMEASLAVPTFRVGYTITTDALDALYKKIKSKGVTMTALLAKATALALAKHPVVNAACKDGKSFTYNSSVNVAVAVAMDGGLLTPVLQDADKVDIYTLSRKWKELVDKARAKQLSPAEYNTGTFTLSNLGMFGVDRFDAILPPGQGAIMAVGASKPVLVAQENGLFGVQKQMQVNVTADHRIIYGGDLAEFLQTFAKIIEKPDELTL
eukprot:jgi/Mesen1/3191/ME000184S02251